MIRIVVKYVALLMREILLVLRVPLIYIINGFFDCDSRRVIYTIVENVINCIWAAL